MLEVEESLEAEELLELRRIRSQGGDYRNRGYYGGLEVKVEKAIVKVKKVVKVEENLW